jgi:hypothetical protein
LSGGTLNTHRLPGVRPVSQGPNGQRSGYWRACHLQAIALLVGSSPEWTYHRVNDAGAQRCGRLACSYSSAWRSHSSIQAGKHREPEFEQAEVLWWREARLGRLCGTVSFHATSSQVDWPRGSKYMRREFERNYLQFETVYGALDPARVKVSVRLIVHTSIPPQFISIPGECPSPPTCMQSPVWAQDSRATFPHPSAELVCTTPAASHLCLLPAVTGRYREAITAAVIRSRSL